MNFFAIFFLIFYYGSARNTSERFFLLSLFHSLFQPIFAWKEAMMIFSNFFEIFYFGSGRNPFERILLFSLFLGLSHSILAWNDAMLVFSNFLNFSAIFFNFLLRVGQEHIGTIFFIFSLSRPFPTYFAWKEAMTVFSNFFCYFFGIFFSGSGRNPLERILLFSLFLCLSHPILAWNEAMMVFSNFLNFFALFFEFSIMSQIGGTHRNDFFYFLPFSFFCNLSWLEKNP